MALELFKPFIYSKLELKGMAATIKMAKKLVEKELPEVWDILEEVIREHPVMLNRAPTLHRLGIQAFEPVLIEGKGIQLHPLVCAAFNADFDGDQMAVHVPLSLEAQLEARVLMMSTNNILSPANGKPIIVPSQDIVLGLYYMTLMRENEVGDGMAFATLSEIEMALETGAVSLHAKITARFETVDEKGKSVVQRVESTPGRMILAKELPRNPALSFELVNQLLSKKAITHVIDVIYRHCGQKETVLFADHLMQLGFRFSTQAGISFGKDDMVIPAAKAEVVTRTQNLVKEYEQQYSDGLITQGEKYNKVIDAWSQSTDQVADMMMAGIGDSAKQIDPETGRLKQSNSVFMMADSGARGSAAQMKQLAGMRGLMAKPSGEIIETPIISNFKEGLSVLEYFNSTHGARKGLADTALKTANSGYLTRRLVDVAQDCIIVENDCGTTKGITVKEVLEGGDIIVPLSERILGRAAARTVKDPVTGKKLFTAGTVLGEVEIEAAEKAGLDQLVIRSVLTCESSGGVCGICYGRDLARGTAVNIGEAVGVIAAQSIGEPGTQLTMRTFHIGGTAQHSEESSIETAHNATVTIHNRSVVEDSQKRLVVMGRNVELVLTDQGGHVRARHKVPYGAVLRVDDGDEVKKGAKIAERDPYTIPIISEISGIAGYRDVIEGIAMREIVDEATGISNQVIIDWRQQPKGDELKPRITLRDDEGKVLMLENGLEARYFLPVDAVMSIADGATVHAGDVLARIPRESSKTRDITGGLPRVAELFEGRKPKDHAIIAEIDGTIEFGKDYKAKRRIIVRPKDDSQEPVEALIPKGKHIAVREGDFVHRGEPLLDGNPVPHDILKVLGVEALAK